MSGKEYKYNANRDKRKSPIRSFDSQSQSRKTSERRKKSYRRDKDKSKSKNDSSRRNDDRRGENHKRRQNDKKNKVKMPSNPSQRNDEKKRKEGYDGLCVSSGGYKGFGILGALTILDIEGYFENTTKFAGCSVGSVITLLMAVGWKPIELYRESVKIKIFNGMQDIDIDGFKDNFGIMSNDSIRDELEGLVLKKKEYLPTLMELHDEGIYLAFSVCDRRAKKGYKIDWKSNPNLLATEGCLMSSNIPFVFPPIDFDGMMIVDGALTNPFPLDYLDNKKDKILGIVVYGTPSDDSESLMAYGAGTIMVGIEEMQRMTTRYASDAVDVLEMFVGDLNVLNTEDAYAEKLAMYFAGMKDGKLLVKAKNRIKRKKKKIKPTVNVGVKHFSSNVITKCLISQPLDILCQSSLVAPATLQENFKNLSEAKQSRIKEFAKLILADEVTIPISHGIPDMFKSSSMPDVNGPPKPPIGIQENYSQRIYDSLPLQLKAITKVMVDSMSPEEADRTIDGVNVIFEGLNRLGMNVLEMPIVTQPRVEVYDEESQTFEITEKGENKMSEID